MNARNLGIQPTNKFAVKIVPTIDCRRSAIESPDPRPVGVHAGWVSDCSKVEMSSQNPTELMKTFSAKLSQLPGELRESATLQACSEDAGVRAAVRS